MKPSPESKTRDQSYIYGVTHGYEEERVDDKMALMPTGENEGNASNTFGSINAVMMNTESGV